MFAFGWFVAMTKLWGLHECAPGNTEYVGKPVDVIAVVSYGARETDVTNSTNDVIIFAKGFTYRYPQAKVVYGVFTYSPHPEIEKRKKEAEFPKGVCVGTVASTIEECLKIKNALASESIHSIVVVTGACHSRTAKLVWQTYFPDVEILISSIPATSEIDRRSPMLFARNGWAWFGINVVRHLVFGIIGVKRMAKLNLHTPVAKK